MKVNVVDAGCGIGKTTALINKINNDTTNQKYIFITPFLSEVERIKEGCKSKNFIDPQQQEGTKTRNIIELINTGQNIVTTHALFRRLTPSNINLEKLKDYTLIMDEVADIIDEIPISKSDLKLLSERYMTIQPKTHMVEWNDPTYNGKLDEYMNMIKEGNIFAHVDNNKNTIVSLVWLFPYKIFEAFKSIFILTYMFDGQIQKKYFDYFNATYYKWYIKDFNLTPEFQIYDYSKTKSLIHVCESEKLNAIGDKINALSMSWFSRNKKSDAMAELQTNTSNFFRTYANVKSKDTLWTTFKEYKKCIQKKGFTTGFAPINSRATNEYGTKRAIAYLGNRYFKPTIKNFFIFNNIDSSSAFEDKFALSELVQFIYRSAIRNNKSIYVFIPSKRMRDLFLDWLKKTNI